MKKAIIGLVGIILLSSFVMADYVDVFKGWNLVHFYDNPVDSITNTSEVQIDDIEIMYVYINFMHKMYEVYPDMNTAEEEIGPVLDNMTEDGYLYYIVNSAWWVYSNKEGKLEVEREVAIPISLTRLLAGWNFIGMTPGMIGSTVGELAVECDPVAAYVWDTENQMWGQINLYEKTTSYDVGNGFLVYVENDCRLTEKRWPPQFPILPI